MEKAYGEKRWVFPDGDRPPVHRFDDGADETIMILNTSDETAHVKMTVFYTNREPVEGAVIQVPAESVRCVKTGELYANGSLFTGIHEQYAFVLNSDVAVVAQYLKVSDDEQPMHVYGMMGYGCDQE